jgi:hypothetical protein
MLKLVKEHILSINIFPHTDFKRKNNNLIMEKLGGCPFDQTLSYF